MERSSSRKLTHSRKDNSLSQKQFSERDNSSTVGSKRRSKRWSKRGSKMLNKANLDLLNKKFGNTPSRNKNIEPLKQQNYDVEGESKGSTSPNLGRRKSRMSHFKNYAKSNPENLKKLGGSSANNTSINVKSLGLEPNGELENGNEMGDNGQTVTKTTTTTTSVIQRKQDKGTDDGEHANASEGGHAGAKRENRTAEAEKGGLTGQTGNESKIQNLNKGSGGQESVTKTVTTTRTILETLKPNENLQNSNNAKASETSLKIPKNKGTTDSSSSLKIQTEKLLISPPNKGVGGNNEDLVTKKTTTTTTTEIIQNAKNAGDRGLPANLSHEVEPLINKIDPGATSSKDAESNALNRALGDARGSPGRTVTTTKTTVLETVSVPGATGQNAQGEGEWRMGKAERHFKLDFLWANGPRN